MKYLIIFIFLCFSLMAEDKIVLQLKWEHQFQFAGYYAALEQGYYQEQGLDVEIREQNLKKNIDIVREVVDNEAYYAVGSSSLLVDIVNGQPLMLLAAIFEHSPLVLLSHKSSDIRAPRDLNGKRIMLAEDEGQSVLLSRLLQADGINYVSVTPDFNGFLQGEADTFSAYLGNEPYQLTQKALPYTIIDPANYGLDAYSDFLYTSQNEYKKHPKRVHDFIEASIRGWKYALAHQKEIAELISKKYKPSRSIDALLFEASMICRYSIIDRESIGKIELNKLSHMILMMKEAAILDKHLDLREHVYPAQFVQVELSDKERKWISEHPVISYSSVHWRPSEASSLEKEISRKYVNLIALKSGLNFSYVQKEPYSYALAELERGRIDLFIGTQGSKNSLESDVVRAFPLVLVTRNDVDYISHIDSLNLKTMALVKGSLSAQYIQSNYPKIKKVYVKDIKEALRLVASSEVFATAEILPLVSLHIKEFNMANLKISGEFPYKYKLKSIVRSEYPELLSIINKAIANISIDEHTMINDSWNSVDFVKEEDKTLLVIGIILAGTLIFILIYSNWRLREEVHKRELAENELQRMLDVVNQNIYMSMTDHEGNITYVSEAFCRLCGYSQDQLMGINHRILKSSHTPESFYDQMWAKLSTGNIWKGELENVTKSGKPYWVESSITPIYDEEGEITNYMAIRKDITDKKQMEKLAITDALSELYNRRYFNMVFEKEINRLKRESGTISFLMLDIDHFKLYNDKYGHLKGDEVIMAVSQCLKEVCQRATDQVFRLGGEEFGVLLLGMEDTQVYAFAQKIIRSIENLNIKHEENHPYTWVTASLGAVTCHLDLHSKLDAKSIYQIADDAMYTSKKTGRNRIFISQA